MVWDMKCTIFALVIAIVIIICLILIYNVYKINKVVPSVIERGTIESITHAAESGQLYFGLSDPILFTKTFSSIPQIYFSPTYLADGFISASAHNLSKTGFQSIIFATASGTTTNLHWIAVGW